MPARWCRPRASSRSIPISTRSSAARPTGGVELAAGGYFDDRFWRRRVAYPAYVEALMASGYDGYIDWEFCHPAIENGKPAGIEYVHTNPACAGIHEGPAGKGPVGQVNALIFAQPHIETPESIMVPQIQSAMQQHRMSQASCTVCGTSLKRPSTLNRSAKGRSRATRPSSARQYSRPSANTAAPVVKPLNS